MTSTTQYCGTSMTSTTMMTSQYYCTVWFFYDNYCPTLWYYYDQYYCGTCMTSTTTMTSQSSAPVIPRPLHFPLSSQLPLGRGENKMPLGNILKACSYMCVITVQCILCHHSYPGTSTSPCNHSYLSGKF